MTDKASKEVKAEPQTQTQTQPQAKVEEKKVVAEEIKEKKDVPKESTTTQATVE